MAKPEKRCPECGETKSRDAFSGRNAYCRPCGSKRQRARYWSNAEYREQRKAYHREHERKKRADPARNAVVLERLRQKRRDNPEWRARTLAAVNARRRNFLGRYLAQRAALRAEKKGVECSITPEWVQGLWESSPTCIYCDRGLRAAQSRHAPDSATLDRVRCTEGYTKENTVLACFRCNTLKRDSSPEELETLAANIRRVLRGGGIEP